jgi:hypothetical protein
MRPIFVVLGLPSLQFSSKIPFMFEMPALVELLGIGSSGPGDTSPLLGSPGRVGKDYATARSQPLRVEIAAGKNP